MSHPEIPGFYFDTTRNRYFKISNAVLSVDDKESVLNYSQTNIRKRQKIKDLESKDDQFKPLSSYQLMRQLQFNQMYKDNWNLHSKPVDLRHLQMKLKLSNVVHKKSVQLESQQLTRQIIYDLKDDNLIMTSYDQLFMTSFSNVRDGSSAALDLDILYQHMYLPNYRRLPFLKIKLLNSYSSSNNNILLALREKKPSSHVITLSKIYEPDFFFDNSQRRQESSIQEYQNFEVTDFNSVGDISLTDNCIALTSVGGIDLIDFRRLKKKLQFKYARQKKSDFLTLDFQQRHKDILCTGMRSGEVFFIDTRKPPNSGLKSLQFDIAVPCVSLKFVSDSSNYVVVNGLSNYMSLFDMRNLSVPLIKYESYNNLHDLSPCVETKKQMIIVNDSVMKQIKIYDLLGQAPIKILGNENVLKFITTNESASEVCILNDSNKELEYWSS